jgi:hypothetical protein
VASVPPPIYYKAAVVEQPLLEAASTFLPPKPAQLSYGSPLSPVYKETEVVAEPPHVASVPPPIYYKAAVVEQPLLEAASTFLPPKPAQLSYGSPLSPVYKAVIEPSYQVPVYSPPPRPSNFKYVPTPEASYTLPNIYLQPKNAPKFGTRNKPYWGWGRG